MLGPDFADKMFEYLPLKDEFETELLKHVVNFERIGWDDYDNSLEIYNVPDDVRLKKEGLEFIYGCGFTRIYVNHKDGWQTHYHTLSTKSISTRGWRRKEVPETPERSRHFLISYWPESWSDPRCQNWLESGFMVIVPDPLEINDV